MTSKLVLLQIKEFIKEHRQNFPETEEVMNLHNKILVAIMNLLDKENEEKLTDETKQKIQILASKQKY